MCCEEKKKINCIVTHIISLNNRYHTNSCKHTTVACLYTVAPCHQHWANFVNYKPASSINQYICWQIHRDCDFFIKDFPDCLKRNTTGIFIFRFLAYLKSPDLVNDSWSFIHQTFMVATFEKCWSDRTCWKCERLENKLWSTDLQKLGKLNFDISSQFIGLLQGCQTETSW